MSRLVPVSAEVHRWAMARYAVHVAADTDEPVLCAFDELGRLIGLVRLCDLRPVGG
jgi:hypothetical protein